MQLFVATEDEMQKMSASSKAGPVVSDFVWDASYHFDHRATQFMGGQSGSWALAHLEKHPGLHLGYHLSLVEQTSDGLYHLQINHIFTHDEFFAYDAYGSYSLPYADGEYTKLGAGWIGQVLGSGLYHHHSFALAKDLLQECDPFCRPRNPRCFADYRESDFCSRDIPVLKLPDFVEFA